MGEGGWGLVAFSYSVVLVVFASERRRPGFCFFFGIVGGWITNRIAAATGFARIDPKVHVRCCSIFF